MSITRRFKFHYSWLIFGAGFLMVFTVLGFCSSTKSLFLAPVTADTGIPRTLFSLNDCARYIVVGTMNVFFGRFVEKFSPRRMVAIGFINLIISQLLFSFSSNVVLFVLAGAFLGAGLAWTTTSMVGFFVGKWFTNSKGSVMGIILAANGLGAATAAQVIGSLINAGSGMWRVAYRVSALLVAIVGVIAVLVFRNDPKDLGLEPLGQDAIAKKKRGADWDGLEFSELIKKPYFYITILCVFSIGTLLTCYTSSGNAHMKDIGIDGVSIKNIMSIHALLLFAAKLLTGFIFDKKGLRTIMNICRIVGTMSCLALILATSVTGAAAYSFLMSFAMPMETVLMPLLAAEMFGKKAYVKTMGIMVGTMQFGACAGNLIPNLCFDAIGTYRPAYILFLVLFVITMIVLNFMITKARKEREAFEKRKPHQGLPLCTYTSV